MPYCNFGPSDIHFVKNIGSHNPLAYGADPNHPPGVWATVAAVAALGHAIQPLPAAAAQAVAVAREPLLAVSKTTAFVSPSIGGLIVLCQRRAGVSGSAMYTHIGVVVSDPQLAPGPYGGPNSPVNFSPKGKAYCHYVWVHVLAMGQHPAKQGLLAPFHPPIKSRPAWFMEGGEPQSVLTTRYAPISNNVAGFQQALWDTFFPPVRLLGGRRLAGAIRP